MFLETLNSAENVLNILYVWSAQQKPELGLTEISRCTGINKSTAYKILLSLRERGLVAIDPESKKYRLDVGILELSSHLLRNMDLRSVAHPLLKELAERSGKTVTLALCKERHLVFIDRVDGCENVRFYCDVGKVVYYNTGAAGKAAFAFLPPGQMRDILMEAPVNRFTPNSRSWEQMIDEAPLIQKNGYAISDEEVDAGVYAVGTPLFDHRGRVVAGMALATLKYQLSEQDQSEMIALALEYSEAISRRLGCPRRGT